LHLLNFTQSLAASRFNAEVLDVIERDALQMAALKLQSDPKTSKITTSLLISTANLLLPKLNNPDGVRLFFATIHHGQDAAFDSLQNFVQFILSQVRHFEELIAASAQKDEPEELAQLVSVVDDFVETYSYIIDAAYGLHAQGLIPPRRSQELREIANYSASNASIFDRAFALHEQRIADELSSDNDSPYYQ
jgi:hypothetical protein